MCNTKGVRGRVLPLGADSVRLWHLTGLDIPCTGIVPASSTTHAEVELVLPKSPVAHLKPPVIHSTSWCEDGPVLWVNYIAIMPVAGFVYDEWPQALPITPELVEHVGKPLPHAVNKPPEPNDFNVMTHALGHVVQLINTNSDIREALEDTPWPEHLKPLKPVLAQMYEAA